jgi:glycogen debranching enzyme
LRAAASWEPHRDARAPVDPAGVVTDLVNLAESTVVKGPDAFCLATRDGSLPLEGDHPLGLYLEDCRHLRGHELRVGGRPLRLLVADDVVGTMAVFELTNPDLLLADGTPLPMQKLRARLERRIVPGGMSETLTLHSFASEEVRAQVELAVDADFTTMLEIRGLVAPHEREVACAHDADRLTFSAVGLDGKRRSTTVVWPEACARADGCLAAAVTLAPGQQRSFVIAYELDNARMGAPAGTATPSGGAEQADAWLLERPHVSVDEELVQRVLRRSLLDLRALESELDGLTYYAAGLPWYATLFGRDALITSMQTLAFNPQVAERTLRLLAARLGTRIDDEHDEEPGKVLHELRRGEIAELGLTPLARYYGTVDATPLFLCLLAEHAHWTGSLAVFDELRPQVDQALRWIDAYGDLDGDGLIEYSCRSPAGLVNQGWKDSWDGIVDEDGVPLRAPIAVVEAQGYALRAKCCMAGLFELVGEPERAAELRAGAARLATLLERFWLEDRGYYAMALDGDKRPSAALASNQGHLLWSLAVPTERAAAIRDALMGPRSHSGWGVRTLASSERAYNPIGYHTGTVWPHDNALLALGLRRYGFDADFLRIFDDLLDAATTFSAYRLPELFAGYARRRYEAPVPYPVACSPQAWAAGSLPAMLTASLGLIPDALNGTLRICRPSLPRDVSRLAVHELRVGDAVVDLVFQRVAPNTVALVDVDIEGRLDVVLEIRPGRDPDAAPSLAEVSALSR